MVEGFLGATLRIIKHLGLSVVPLNKFLAVVFNIFVAGRFLFDAALTFE